MKTFGDKALLVIYFLSLYTFAWSQIAYRQLLYEYPPVVQAQEPDRSKQVDVCDNLKHAPNSTTQAHDCDCNKATTCYGDNEPPSPGEKCKTYCRPHDCKCAEPSRCS